MCAGLVFYTRPPRSPPRIVRLLPSWVAHCTVNGPRPVPTKCDVYVRVLIFRTLGHAAAHAWSAPCRLLGETRTLPDGRAVITRMSWVNVTDDTLDWHWERSFDGGTSWEMDWEIHYERAGDR